MTSVFRSYRDALSLPGTRGFSAAGALARLPLSMLGIGLVLLVEATTGSYATAGTVAGVFGLTAATTSPVLARAVDRFGQARIMLPAIALHVAGLILLTLCAQLHAPIWTIYAAAVVAGASIGSIGALVRARWSFVLKGHERESTLRHTAYSLESVVDEVVFVSGPLLVSLLATQLAPALGIVVAALAVGGGGTLLMLQRRTEPPATGSQHAAGPGVLRSPGMVVLCLAMVCSGMIFGSAEVLAVAFADERHHLGRAGWVLAAFALGSLLAGIGYGSVQWSWSAGPRLRLGVVLLAAGVVPLLFVQNLAQMTLVVFIAGFGISPMLISGNALVQELVDPARLTEGLTWTNSGIGIGVSAGAALAGLVVDAAGAQRGFAVPVLAGMLAATLVLLCSRWLRATGPSGDPDQAVLRVAARVLLIDEHGRVLLFRGSDVTCPEAGHWWFTPGGGAEAGESLVETARREVREETGQVLPDDLGPIVLTRTTRFRFEGQLYQQTESFFRVTATQPDVDYSGWTETERRTVQTHRWWTADEISRSTETIYPEGLPDLLSKDGQRPSQS